MKTTHRSSHQFRSCPVTLTFQTFPDPINMRLNQRPINQSVAYEKKAKRGKKSPEGEKRKRNVLYMRDIVLTTSIVNVRTAHVYHPSPARLVQTTTVHNKQRQIHSMDLPLKFESRFLDTTMFCFYSLSLSPSLCLCVFLFPVPSSFVHFF